MESGELLARVYAGIFKYPLTQKEARLWRIKLKNTTNRKLDIAKTVVESLQKIPFIEAVFVTGSVAAGNANKSADIDLMIIATPGTLWLTRLFVVLFLKSKTTYKKTICPNIFLDTYNLKIKTENVYTAHEVLQAKCLYDKNNIYYRWISENKWAGEYLPGAFSHCHAELVSASKQSLRSRNKFGMTLIAPFELLAFTAQYLFMKHKMTNETVGLGYAFFHPRDRSKDVLEKFNKRLHDLGIMEK